jgi:hypothetical protein
LVRIVPELLRIGDAVNTYDDWWKIENRTRFG